MVSDSTLLQCRALFLSVVLSLCLSCFNDSGVSISSDDDSRDTGSGGISIEESNDGVYLIGAGMYDVTGPAAEIGMMGFAEVAQKTEGIFMRLRSRAFIIGDGTKRVVFVSSETGMIFQAVKQKVVEKVAANPALARYYNDTNILLSAIHTHSGPGGYSHYFLYNATTLGFIEQNFDAIVDGIYNSILRAHKNIAKGKIYMAKGELEGASMNRSPLAYENNPADERAQYKSNVDTTMTLLKLVGLDGREIGMINWFAVHPTSIGPSNMLIASDNKGLAAYWFEKDKGTDYLSDSGFVAAFAQANPGDVTPNLWGPADGVHDYEHMKFIARKQYEKAVMLYNKATEPVRGPVDFRHSYVDFAGLHVDEAGCDTCDAAMGVSFSAGSMEDNRPISGMFPEGVTRDSLSWESDAGHTFLQNILSGILGVVWPDTLEDGYIECQAEKPILLPTGRMSFDGNPLTPPIMPLQILRIGPLAIIAQPNEVTTMAGRRLRATVLGELDAAGVRHAVIAGYANAYTSYLTTREEYAMQDYEGACVQFGPYTLMGYQQEMRRIAAAMRSGDKVDRGPIPPDLTGYQACIQPGVVLDEVPDGVNFGNVETDAPDACSKGDTVSVVFWGAHPRNNLMIQGSYLSVEKKSNGEWVPVARDWDPETTFRWKRSGTANSKITITWDTATAEPGAYRIRYFGHYKTGIFGKIVPFEGTSKEFVVQ
jgi:neutral ceramidase